MSSSNRRENSRRDEVSGKESNSLRILESFQRLVEVQSFSYDKTWGTGVMALGEGQGEATGESSAIVLISGVPAFDVFGLFRGDIPLIGLFLGESPTFGLPLGLLVRPGLGCFVDESRRFWFLKDVLKLSWRSSVVAMLSLQQLRTPPGGFPISGLLSKSLSTPSRDSRSQKYFLSLVLFCLLLGRLAAADCIVSFSARTVLGDLHLLSRSTPTSRSEMLQRNTRD